MFDYEYVEALIEAREWEHHWTEDYEDEELAHIYGGDTGYDVDEPDDETAWWRYPDINDDFPF